MRLTDSQRQTIQNIVTDELGPGASVKLFGSRLDDAARGGDIDLFIELDEPVEHPTQLAARLSVRIMRTMYGRKVDVLLSAPNLSEQAIHSWRENREFFYERQPFGAAALFCPRHVR